MIEGRDRMMRLTVALVALVLGACGYTFQGGGSVLPVDVRRIYIPLAENESAEPGLAALLTEALRDRFDRFGVVTVVDDLPEADAILRSRILRVDRNTATTTSNTDIALQFDATLQISAELKRVTGQTLWRDMNITVSKSYGTDSGSVVTSSAEFSLGGIGSSDFAALQSNSSREVARGQEAEALAYLTEKAAREIYDSAVAPDF